MSIYTLTQINKIDQVTIINKIFEQKINFLLNQKFLIFKNFFFN
jgi:hypothetical protein